MNKYFFAPREPLDISIFSADMSGKHIKIAVHDHDLPQFAWPKVGQITSHNSTLIRVAIDFSPEELNVSSNIALYMNLESGLLCRAISENGQIYEFELPPNYLWAIEFDQD